jgi:hypothetical protein
MATSSTDLPVYAYYRVLVVGVVAALGTGALVASTTGRREAAILLWTTGGLLGLTATLAQATRSEHDRFLGGLGGRRHA